MLTGDPVKDDIYRHGRAPKRSSKPIFDWFLIALAILIPIDVALRRIQIDFASIRSALGFGRRMAPTATMGALLQAKQSATAAIQSRRSERPLPPTGTGATPMRSPSTSSTVVKQKPADTPPPEAPAGPATSTTERLLALKRKRDEDK